MVIKFTWFFILLSEYKVLVEFCMCSQLVTQPMSQYIVASWGQRRPFFKMAAIYKRTARLQADKLILVGGRLGYPAHIVCLPPTCVAGSIAGSWSIVTVSHWDLLLVLQSTVGAQKIGVMGNTIQVLLQFSSGVSLPKIIKIDSRLTKLLQK